MHLNKKVEKPLWLFTASVDSHGSPAEMGTVQVIQVAFFAA